MGDRPREQSPIATMRQVSINDSGATPHYPKNKLCSTKYTYLNFLPRNLSEQFRRFVNRYFLVIAFLQLWPTIAPVDSTSVWLPLIFLFSVSAGKEAWDDHKRYLQDKTMNERMVWVTRNGTTIQVCSEEICVGDIVWIRETDSSPCDLILLGSSDKSGLCFIETSSFDGETDWKPRSVPLPCVALSTDLLVGVKGTVECPAPNHEIGRFEAILHLVVPTHDPDICSLDLTNTIWQSCVLRNTEWAYGVAIYTGNESKLGLSKGIPPSKTSSMDQDIDRLSGAMFLLQLVVVLSLGVTGNGLRFGEATNNWYLMYENGASLYEGLKIPLSIELLCSVMIPISLKVTSDLVKGFLSKLIDWDLQMYDESSGTPSCSLNTGIPEDLALVDYVFADKTGTLTENQMVFCKCFIQGLVYSANIQDPSEDTFLNEAAREDRQCSKDFLLVMALCNTVVPCYSETGEVSYKAQSQDEEALVKAAAKAGVSLVAKKGMFSVLRVMGREVEYELLNVLEFTSDRKCMSVVVKQQPEGTILLLSKGADEVMFSRLAAGQQFQQALNATEQFSSEGLRTLCLTSRRISEEEYYQWSQMFETARLSLFDREWKISEAAKILERDLVLLGITAIKDKLQDGVQDTIDILRRAGINIWMLTGDKKITALEIARACNLLSAESQLMEVVGQNLLEVKSCINHLLDILASFSSFHQKDAALIVEGTTLEMALMEDKDAFTALAMKVKTGICCRVTPSQKAQLVMLMKEGNFRTMAVGDGGNDVRMIQVAHVGVGITGHEGCQAARAADYSLGRFRFLSRLILVHGRYAYTRMAFIVQYSFYKSMLLAWIQIIYCFYSYISGSSLFNTYSLMVYNFLYTSLPCFMYAIEQDVPENVVMSNPAILQNCRKRRCT